MTLDLRERRPRAADPTPSRNEKSAWVAETKGDGSFVVVRRCRPQNTRARG